MKELMHSKRFRNNLFKWLFMYIGVIGIITCAWTYSKYITSLKGNDVARVAKFNVNITFDDEGCVGNEVTCNIGSYRPTEEFNYYFTVDTTELEVSTRLAILLTLNEQFEFIELENIDTGDKISLTSEATNKFSFTEDILASDDNRIKKYKVTSKFNKDYDANYSIEHDISGSLRIGYSAIQIS